MSIIFLSGFADCVSQGGRDAAPCATSRPEKEAGEMRTWVLMRIRRLREIGPDAARLGQSVRDVRSQALPNGYV